VFDNASELKVAHGLLAIGTASVCCSNLLGSHELLDQLGQLTGVAQLLREAVDIVLHLGIALEVAVADLASPHIERLIMPWHDVDLVAECSQRHGRLNGRVEDDSVSTSSNHLLNEI